MAETTLRPAWGSAQCGCGCRPADACKPGCGCPECQPGPGIDHVARRRNTVAVRRERLRDLLTEQDFRNLSKEEDEELESLLHLYLNREA